jgi:hypothetical protein
LESSYQNSKYCPNLVQHLETVDGNNENKLSKNLKIGSSLFVDIFIFFTYIVSEITFDKKLAIDVLI